MEKLQRRKVPKIGGKNRSFPLLDTYRNNGQM